MNISNLVNLHHQKNRDLKVKNFIKDWFLTGNLSFMDSQNKKKF